jgi:propanol-preferring alcohol dehydrogenase
MYAMLLHAPGTPLVYTRLPDRLPGHEQVLIEVGACGVCRTDLHVVDGELAHPHLPLIPGHEIVGRITALGKGVNGLSLGQRVGVPWLGLTCGACPYCLAGRENLCDQPGFTGYTLDGGFATAVIAHERYVFPLGERGSDESLAPLLCAGLIGWRALSMAGPGKRLGLYGFGAAAHIIIQVAIAQGREVFAFTRPGDLAACTFARQLGAIWAGGSDEQGPEPLDAAIIFAPVGGLVPVALGAVRKGARVVCAGIHMSDIPTFPYRLLWEERSLLSVANLTREDGVTFLQHAASMDIATHTRSYPLKQANQALDDLRNGNLQGAAVLMP